jgi:hypothetical protein
VADPGHNVAGTLGLARRASEMGAVVALFPAPAGRAARQG